MPTQLSVNVNKIAVLRNSRGGGEPDPLRAAKTCIAAGANGITVHPRPDRRHIVAEDVYRLRDLCRGAVELNIEGNPFAPARPGYPGLIPLAEATRPEQCTLVPDADGQITSDHGFDLARDAERLRPLIAALKQVGCRVSLFIDAGTEQLDIARDIGADRIEIYTGPFAEAHAAGTVAPALADCARTARAAQAAGLGVNAGHDLSQSNLEDFLVGVPEVLEVSIGHALFSEAIYAGLDATVRRYLALTGAT
ncbi:pyridoxine 5'-phosphate synthase [Pseudomarimonas arenosa]|uniref:Pyridoxine 5'-phosphate synthase n=1 Tax=Pseudomarimonas arenosa TaxID=2774145 RepID=A0AAW3ZPB3_9GAMM|nr:pyridoxine 5'-phosphate synthase [Pseudomarimonas arenosa]MBD8527956.1 pyridoxine 5'-phosphate synthase [Pseudomarimonas arenosa]